MQIKKPCFSDAVFARWLVGSSRLMLIVNYFYFLDNNGQKWEVKSGVKVDGASIPRFFWVFIGSPFVGKYRRASVVHDVYCNSKVRSCVDTHKMFYNAMRVDKVNYFKAKAMYFAVRMGGPKW